MKEPLENLLTALEKQNTKQAEELVSGKKDAVDDKGAEHRKAVWALLGDREGR